MRFRHDLSGDSRYLSEVDLHTRALRSFATVAEVGNISHAAVRLSLTQPALSRLITKLEKDLSTVLFERDARGVSLTAAGERALARTNRLLEQVDALDDELRSFEGRIQGKVCVAMPDTTGHTLFLPLLDRMERSHPEIEVRVMGAHPNNVPLALSAGDGDIGIISSAHKSGGYSLTPFVTEQLHLISPYDEANNGEADIQLDDVGDLPLALPAISPGLRQPIDRAFALRGVRPNVAYQVDSQDALLELVRDKRAHSIMSFAGVQRLSRRKLVSARRIVHPTIERSLSLAVPANRSMTAPIRSVIDELQNLSAELASQARWTVDS